MPTIHLQVAITFEEESSKNLAALLGPALRQALGPADFDEKREARLRASQHALFGGQKPPTDQGLLIDAKQVSRLLKVSPRTLWRMYQSGEMPSPIRIGKAVRWSAEAIKKWVDAGCPAVGR